jgi:hypothetical protein
MVRLFLGPGDEPGRFVEKQGRLKGKRCPEQIVERIAHRSTVKSPRRVNRTLQTE